jgi:hypothetical protein
MRERLCSPEGPSPSSSQYVWNAARGRRQLARSTTDEPGVPIALVSPTSSLGVLSVAIGLDGKIGVAPVEDAPQRGARRLYASWSHPCSARRLHGRRMKIGGSTGGEVWSLA